MFGWFFCPLLYCRLLSSPIVKSSTFRLSTSVSWTRLSDLFRLRPRPSSLLAMFWAAETQETSCVLPSPWSVVNGLFHPSTCPPDRHTLTLLVNPGRPSSVRWRWPPRDLRIRGPYGPSLLPFPFWLTFLRCSGGEGDCVPPRVPWLFKEWLLWQVGFSFQDLYDRKPLEDFFIGPGRVGETTPGVRPFGWFGVSFRTVQKSLKFGYFMSVPNGFESFWVFCPFLLILFFYFFSLYRPLSAFEVFKSFGGSSVR